MAGASFAERTAWFSPAPRRWCFDKHRHSTSLYRSHRRSIHADETAAFARWIVSSPCRVSNESCVDSELEEFDDISRWRGIWFNGGGKVFDWGKLIWPLYVNRSDGKIQLQIIEELICVYVSLEGSNTQILALLVRRTSSNKTFSRVAIVLCLPIFDCFRVNDELSSSFISVVDAERFARSWLDEYVESCWA